MPDLGPGDVLGRFGGADGLFLAFAGTFFTVEDVGFGDFGVSALDEDFFHGVLDFFDSRRVSGLVCVFQYLDDLLAQLLSGGAVSAANGDGGTINCVGDAEGEERHFCSAAFDDKFNIRHDMPFQNVD